MRLFMLGRYDTVVVGELACLVVAAESVRGARAIAADNAGSEGVAVWNGNEKSYCELIGASFSTTPHVVLRNAPFDS